MNTNHIPITSSELGNLWLVFQKQTMLMRMLEYFINKAESDESKTIMDSHYRVTTKSVEELKTIFTNEGAVLPIAFTSKDVAADAPPLFDYFFDIMFLRVLMKVTIGINALHSTMSYRSDIIDFYTNLTNECQKTYKKCTQFLLEKGVLARPPMVSMPKEVEIVNNENYMSGFNPFNEKRALNTLEVSFIYQGIESNVLGTQLMTGFAQVANEKEVKEYFIKGKELAKKLTSNMSELFLDSDIQSPSSGSGRATDSKIPPFSDKLMMYCTMLLSSFGLTNNALGTTFSLRSDLPVKLNKMAKDIFDFSHEGGKLMIKNSWMEEPPQLEDRNQLSK